MHAKYSNMKHYIVKTQYVVETNKYNTNIFTKEY